MVYALVRKDSAVIEGDVNRDIEESFKAGDIITVVEFPGNDDFEHAWAIELDGTLSDWGWLGDAKSNFDPITNKETVLQKRRYTMNITAQEKTDMTNAPEWLFPAKNLGHVHDKLTALPAAAAARSTLI